MIPPAPLAVTGGESGGAPWPIPTPHRARRRRYRSAMIGRWTHARGPWRWSVAAISLVAVSQLRDAVAQPSPASDGPSASVQPTHGLRVRAKRETTIYWGPAAVRPRRAIVQAGSVVELDGGEEVKRAGCRAAWTAVAGGGFLCPDSVEPTEAPVVGVPRLVDDLLPFVFVHRLDTKAFSYAFLPGEGAERTRLFRRGKLLDESRYALHEPSHFQGRNLTRHPIPDPDLVPGWTVVAEAPVYAAPSAAAAAKRLPRHTQLLVRREPATAGWREVHDAQGQRALGFMKEDDKLRYWVGAPPVKGLAEGETWLDIDVGQQMLALRTMGTGPTYVTLISSGLAERPSPLGVFRVQQKLAYRSMGNLPHSADKYFIENVPWAMYFRPNFAIHGAYWHEEFGNRRSHGCVNLAPRDARYIYAHVPPLQQPGFFETFASDRAPGAVVRLRDSARSSPAPDPKPSNVNPQS
jgi:hypothetical protein